MSHAPHESLRGYSPDQLLVDDCEECEDRAMSRSLGIANLDQQNFARAWKRAVEWNRGEAAHVSNCEAPMLSVLWAVQLQFEKRGLPITGRCPDVWDFTKEPAL